MAVADLLRRPSDEDSGVARTLRPLGDWSAFLATLRDNGFPVSPDREARVATLLWRLADAGIALQRWEDAAGYLAPILCVNADDRDRFGGFLKQHYARQATTAAPGKSTGVQQFQDPARRDRTFFLIFGLAAAAILAVVAWYWFSGRAPAPSIPATPGGTPVDTSASAALDFGVLAQDLFIRFLVACPALFLLAAILAWRQDKRAVLLRRSARIGAEGNYRIPFDRSGLFRDAVSRNALLLLKRAVLVVSDRIDVVRSVQATVAANGWPSLQYRRRRTNVELVLLVDRGKTRDHLGYLADILVDRFTAAQAFVTRYDYRLHPARVTLASGRAEGPAAQDLTRVAHRHTDHRLFLLTDGQGLFLPGTSTLDPALTREFGRFGQVVVLTPTPRNAWGERERALAASGAIVVPATTSGLDVAATLVGSDADDARKRADRDIPEGFDPFLEQLERDFHRLSSDTAPPAEEISEIVMQLSAWMGSRPHYKVLAAVAAFPWIDPGLTLAFGAAVLGRPVDPALFARLARLPWMRSARMPEWLRIALVNRLREDERREVADRMTAVLSLARSRPDGYPLSPDECTALPVAQEDAKRMLANADPKAFGGLQERVFISFLNGDKLNPADPLQLEASEEMKRDIGAEFERRQKVLAGLAFAVAAGAFVFKNELAAALQWIESEIGPSLTFLPPEAEAAYFRPLSLVAVFAAFIVWAVSAWRRPEVTQDEKYVAWMERIEGFVPFLRSIKRIMAHLPVLGPYVNRKAVGTLGQHAWRSCAAMSVLLAFLGIGDGPVSARLILLASIATAAWLEFTRLPMAGAATTLRLGYDDVQVCDQENRCATKPGGLAQYPIGRAIVGDHWIRGSLGILVCSLPALFGFGAICFFFRRGDRMMSGDGVVPLAVVLIASWMLTLFLVRRAIIGQWLLPDRGWSKNVSALADVLFATAAGLFFAALCQSLREILGPVLLGYVLAALFIVMLMGSIPLVALRTRQGASKLNVNWLMGAIGIGLVAQGTVFPVFIIRALNPDVSGVKLGIFVFSVSTFINVTGITFFGGLLYGAISWIRTRVQRQTINSDRWRPIRFRALVTGAVFLVPMIIDLALVLDRAYLLSYLDNFEDNLTGAAFSFLLTLVVPPLQFYTAWRYLSPAALDIGQRKAEGQLQRAAYPAAQTSTRAWWDTPWLALPLVAMYGMVFTTPVIGWWSSLSPFAVPVAVIFAARHGRAALVPIALGTMPFWFGLQLDAIRTAGDVWFAVVIILCAKFTADAEFRARLLQRERLAWSDVALLVLLLIPMVSIELGGGSRFATWPYPMLLACGILLAASRVPGRRTVLALLILFVLAMIPELWSVEPGRVGAIWLGAGLHPAATVAGLFCVILISTYRTATVNADPPQPTNAEQRLQQQVVETTTLLRRDTAIGTLTLAYAFVSATGSLRGFGLPDTSTFTLAAIGFCAGLSIRRSFPDRPDVSAVLVNIVLVTVLAAVLVMLLQSGVIPIFRAKADLDLNQILGVIPLFFVWAGFVAFGHWVRREPPAVLQTAREEPATTAPPADPDQTSQRFDELLRQAAAIQDHFKTIRQNDAPSPEFGSALFSLEPAIARALASGEMTTAQMAALRETQAALAGLRRRTAEVPTPPRTETPASQTAFDRIFQVYDVVQRRIQSAKSEGRIGAEERSGLGNTLNDLESSIGEVLASDATGPDEIKKLHEVKKSIMNLRQDLEHIPAAPEPTEPGKPTA